jgi:type II secretory pathway component PulF
MERLYEDSATTALFISAIALALVSALAVNVLPQFQYIFSGFGTELPFWLDWVYGSYSYWWISATVMFVLFVLSFVPDIKRSSSFQSASAQIAMVGLIVAFLQVVFSVLAIYLPVFQSA